MLAEASRPCAANAAAASHRGSNLLPAGLYTASSTPGLAGWFPADAAVAVYTELQLHKMSPTGAELPGSTLTIDDLPSYYPRKPLTSIPADAPPVSVLLLELPPAVLHLVLAVQGAGSGFSDGGSALHGACAFLLHESLRASPSDSSSARSRQYMHDALDVAARVLQAVVAGAQQHSSGKSTPSIVVLLEPTSSFPTVRMVDTRLQEESSATLPAAGFDSAPMPPLLSLPLAQSSAVAGSASAPMLLLARGHAAQSLRTAAAAAALYYARHELAAAQSTSSALALLSPREHPVLHFGGTRVACHATLVWALPPLVNIRIGLQGSCDNSSTAAPRAVSDLELPVCREAFIVHASVELLPASLANAESNLATLAGAACVLARNATARYSAALQKLLSVPTVLK